MQNKQAGDLPAPRLLSHVISKRAETEPQTTWGLIPKSPTDPSAGFEEVSFARLNYAITRAARWLQETLGSQNSPNHKVLAYIGVPDTRYIIFTIAAIKTGFQMLYLSPRNSDEAQQSVIEQADCHIFLCSTSMTARIQKLLQSHPRLSQMVQLTVPEQDELLQDDFVPDFPYEKTVEEARYEPLVILHTSSTTGIPKTIPLNQGYGMHEDVLRHIPEFKNLDLITRKTFYGPCRMFVAMPLYHGAGILLTLLKSLYEDIVSVFQPPAAPLSADLFDGILRHSQCTGCVIPPYLLEEMLQVPEHLDTLSRLDFVQFGSGPLSKATGEQLISRQKNCPHFIGSTECGIYPLLELDDPTADWQYFRFHPWSGADFRPIDDTKQTCELFIVRSDAPKIPGMQPVFELFPDMDEWPTKDLYVRHPNKPDHWRCIGRNDDVLVLSNGEKLNPVDTEGRINGAHPSVTGALVIGQGRFAPGLLLEVQNVSTSDPDARGKIIEAIWPAIQAANRDAPGHGQLNKELILLTTADKPFLRTPKLTVRRKLTIDLYAEEIAAMYDSYAEGLDISDDENLDSLDFREVGLVEKYLFQCINSETGWNYQPKATEDLFMLGLDSLQVARLTRRINAALVRQGAQTTFRSRILYENSTVKSLSETVHHMATAQAGASDGPASNNHETINALIEEYSQFEPISANGTQIITNGATNHDSPLNVILTGSTGSLGNEILLSLLANPRVARVYCLNRAADAEARQTGMFSKHGLDAQKIEEFKDRIQFLHATSLDAPQLGLKEKSEFDMLKSSRITHVIHNAWPVNFNFALASFKSAIAGVRALIDFCIGMPEHPKFMFISSVGSVTALSSKQFVPETIISDTAAPSPMGYGQSKYVSEHILNRATEAMQSAMPSAILRVGQIAGPVKNSKAAWPAREWLPSLVISSANVVGKLPSDLGIMDQVDWIPVDLLADSIVELLENKTTWTLAEETVNGKQSNVFHVINPRSVSWGELLPSLKAQIDVDETIPLRDWIDLVRQGPDEDSSALQNPAKKILQFYEALVDSAEVRSNGHTATGARFEIANMARCSSTFDDLKPVSGQWLKQWASQWL